MPARTKAVSGGKTPGNKTNPLPMKNLLNLEELAQLLIAVWFFLQLPFAWWWLLVWFLAPDLSMLGYLAGPKTGAICYNLAHHKGTAIAVGFLGIYLQNPILQAAGCILYAHSSFDRVLGYGLKYQDAFTNTHLGKIGKKANF